MGHHITGIIGKKDVLDRLGRFNKIGFPATLIERWGFLPLSDYDLDSLFPAPDIRVKDSCFIYLSQDLVKFLSVNSSESPLAYIETDYFGGVGSQSAVVYHLGKEIFAPSKSKAETINRALKTMGISCGNSFDEFEFLGLNRFRDNDDWKEFAPKDSCL